MKEFEYYSPTKVVFGPQAENQAGKLVKEFGGTRALVHYGGESAKKSGLLGRVLAALGAANVAVVEFGGVQGNPHIELAREGIALCRAEKVDFILAVGGGSVMDSAKAIAYGVPAAHDVWDFFARTATPQSALPMGFIPTLAGTGSEMSDSAVLTNGELQQKRSCKSDFGRPKFTLNNPALGYTVPPYYTAAGCADALMHTLERYLSPDPGLDLTQQMAEGLMRSVMDSARALMRNPESYEERANMLWASGLSHNGLMNVGGIYGDWACHQMGHELNVLSEKTAHGATLTAVWGSWARYVYKAAPHRFALLATRVLELPEEDSEEATALAGIEEMEEFFWAIEMPTTIAEMGLALTDEDIALLANRCTWQGARTVGALKELGEADLIKIYTAAR